MKFNGKTLGMTTPQRIEFMSIPEPMSGCLLWLACTNQDGYGLINADGRTRSAHIVSWELENGPVPEGLELDHKCRVRSCINPAHLRAVTHQANSLAGQTVTAANARKTTCPEGHPYDFVGRAGGRRCQACRKAQASARHAAFREARPA